MSQGQDPDPASFDFTSRWQLAVLPETVWDSLIDFHSWPDWWPGLESVEELDQGDADGIGQRARSRWRGPVGYPIEFEVETIEKQYLESLKGKATGGLVGAGTWRISPVEEKEGAEGTWTRIVFEWRVVATKRWMRVLNPVARPLFVRSHDHVMAKGAEGLADHLGCEIRGFETGEKAGG